MAPESNPSAITLLHPLPGRVVLRRTEPAAAPSPYVIPDQAREKPVEAVVVAVPRLPYYEYGILIPCPVNEGDLCLVGKYAGDVKFRNEDATIIRWDEILAVISEPAASDQKTAQLKSAQDQANEILTDTLNLVSGVVKPDSSLPSAADLDRAAEESAVRAATSSGYNAARAERAVPRL